MQNYILPLAGTALIIAILLGGWYIGQGTEPREAITFELTAIKNKTYTGAYPPLDHVVQISSSFPEDARRTLEEKIEETTVYLKRYPYDGNAWMELALRYHMAGDYQAAERVWLFMTELEPVSVTVLNNLGRLYHFEFKEFEKSEKYFLLALEKNPGRTETYFELFDLYRYSYKKDTTAAVDILKKGKMNFPDDVNFPASLGTYYRDTGRVGLARSEFEEALNIARALGDMTSVETLTAELSRL